MKNEELKSKASIVAEDGTRFRLFDDVDTKGKSGITKCEVVRPNGKIYHAVLDIRRISVISLKEFRNKREYRIHEKDLNQNEQNLIKKAVEGYINEALRRIKEN